MKKIWVKFLMCKEYKEFRKGVLVLIISVFFFALSASASNFIGIILFGYIAVLSVILIQSTIKTLANQYNDYKARKINADKKL